MIKPPTPVDELLRLETLRNLKILDTDPEERFDRVTRLEKRIFGTPIALVSLVHNDRQWFK
ncbi:MAG: GGDEF domain-containing protein, partial [Gammaproteobacteria bacterium]|nr:GGDEF domain-containing protein [Gammaproteobacteria bacterium]